MTTQLGGVRERVPLVAGPRRFVLNSGSAAGDFFQLVDNVPNGGRFPAADVIGLSRRRFDCRGGGTNAVGDIGVAANLHTIAVDIERLTTQDRLDETVVSHVRPLPGAVDGKEPE